MKAEASYYRERLRQELASRCEKNHRYSIRAFGAALGIESSALSQILNGRRSISVKLVDRIFKTVELSDEEQKRFVHSVLEHKKKSGVKRVSLELKRTADAMTVKRTSGNLFPQDIGIDAFRVMSEWYHNAILELTFSPSFKNDVKWIAKTLNISTTDAKLAIDRLLELGLLKEVDGTLKKTSISFDTKDKTKTTSFHRKRQKQVLEKSITSLEVDPIEERNHSGVTMCLNPAQIPAAKAKIQNFLWELTEFLEKGSQERVYELTVNLFPLQKKEGTR
jgi:uncharacterized protein (TIGR02147 family)